MYSQKEENAVGCTPSPTGKGHKIWNEKGITAEREPVVLRKEGKVHQKKRARWVVTLFLIYSPSSGELVRGAEGRGKSLFILRCEE